MDYLIYFLFLFIPVAAIAFFIISLCLFISARKKNRQAPDGIDIQTLSTRRVMLIISSFVAGIIVVIVIGLIILLSLSIKYM